VNSSPYIQVIKSTMRWVGHKVCSRGEVHTGLWWRSHMERTFGRSRHSWEDNIKIDLLRNRKAWTGLTG